MHDDPMDEKSRAGLVGQFKSIRRREVLFGLFGILFIVAGLFVLTVIDMVPGLSLCAFGGILSSVAFSMREDRQLTRKKLSSAGPAAIGPLIEAMYFDEGDVTKARVETAAEIVRL